MKFSMTGVSILVFLINTSLKHYGVDASDESVTAFVQNAIDIITFVGMVYGQRRRTDVKNFIFKK